MKVSNLFRIASIALFTVAIAACSSSQSTSGNNTNSNDRSGSNERGGVDMGGALSSLSYSPNGQGFAYKSTYVNPTEFNTWATQFKPQIETALNALAPGFKLQITGHTCAIGPRDGDGAHLGNVYYSTERAKAVYQALINAGLPKDKLTYKGIANDEPLPNAAPKDQKNRRVTFKIVQG